MGDDEPSLGWTSGGDTGMLLHPDQVDIEDEHDGTEEGYVDVLDVGAPDMARQVAGSLTDAQ